MKKYQIKAFTLVELIIVITILAILATIGFISFQGYTRDARDSNRITSIGEFKKGLDLSFLKDSKYPSPDGDLVLSGTINNQILTYVGEVGDNISKNVRFTTTPKDPLTKNNYVYGTTSDYRYYQIASILEGDIAYNKIINNTYANSEVAKVDGNYQGFLKFNSGANNEEQRIANVPSLIFNNTGSTDLLSSATYFVVNKKSNLPYSNSGIKDTTIQKLDGNKIIQEITGTGTTTLTGVNISGITESNFSNYFSGNTLASFNIKGNDLVNSDKIISDLKVGVLGTSSTTASAPANSCETQTNYVGATFTVGSPTSVSQAWQGTTSTGACYYTCGAGKVLDDGACVSETCAGTTPDGLAKVSNATTFAGGTWNYSPTGGKCTYTCGAGYHTEDSGVSCISDTKSVSCSQSEKPEQNSTYTIANVNITWLGNSWSTAANCTYTCIGGFTGINCDIPPLPPDQILSNGYYVINSNNTTYTTGCAGDISGYDKTKCILKITSVTPNIYVAPSNSDTSGYHLNSNQTSTCGSSNSTYLTETCSRVKTYNAGSALGTSISGYAIDYCNQLNGNRYSKNVPLPSGLTQWFLPPRDIGGLQTIQQNITKVNHVGGSSGYWSSSFNVWLTSNANWHIRWLDNMGGRVSYWSSIYRVRCIAK